MFFVRFGTTSVGISTKSAKMMTIFMKKSVVSSCGRLNLKYRFLYAFNAPNKWRLLNNRNRDVKTVVGINNEKEDIISAGLVSDRCKNCFWKKSACIINITGIAQVPLKYLLLCHTYIFSKRHTITVKFLNTKLGILVPFPKESNATVCWRWLFWSTESRSIYKWKLLVHISVNSCGFYERLTTQVNFIWFLTGLIQRNAYL